MSTTCLLWRPESLLTSSLTHTWQRYELVSAEERNRAVTNTDPLTSTGDNGTLFANDMHRDSLLVARILSMHEFKTTLSAEIHQSVYQACSSSSSLERQRRIIARIALSFDLLSPLRLALPLRPRALTVMPWTPELEASTSNISPGTRKQAQNLDTKGRQALKVEYVKSKWRNRLVEGCPDDGNTGLSQCRKVSCGFTDVNLVKRILL